MAGLVLAFVAVLSAVPIVGALVGAADRPRLRVDLPGEAPPPAAPPSLHGPEPAAPPPRSPEASRRPQNCADPTAPAVRSALPLSLVAGVAADAPRDSLATLARGGERRLLRVGDRFAGAELLGLEWARPGGASSVGAFQLVAVICNQGRKEYVETGSRAGEGHVLAGRPGLLEAVPDGEVRPVGPNQYDIDRDFLDRAFSDLERIPTLARILPSFMGGQGGYSVAEIRPGSFLSVLGLEDGDVIQRINGRELSSPEEALELYRLLRDASHLSIELDRSGEPVRLEYNVKAAEIP
jgi:general secretion pathway protein C